MILISNDDGPASLGLVNLINIASNYDDIAVISPSKQASGSSGSKSVFKDLALKSIKIQGEYDVQTLNGSPVDCVSIGINKIYKNEDIKLCLTGINHGINAGYNIFSSGTFMAAMHAHLCGISSIAFSVCTYENEVDFTGFNEHIHNIIEFAMSSQDNNLLNVNIPYVSSLAGIKMCELTQQIKQDSFEETSSGVYRYAHKANGTKKSYEAGSDFEALHNNYIAVTPVQLHCFENKQNLATT
jgi:5'-nucleotidase